MLQAEQLTKWQLFSLKMTISAILRVKQMSFCAFAQLVTIYIFFLAWDKSCVKWDNSQNSTQKMRTYSWWTFNGCDQSNLCTVKNYWSFWINMSYRRRYTEAFKSKNHPEANYWSVAFSINPCSFLLNLKDSADFV